MNTLIQVAILKVNKTLSNYNDLILNALSESDLIFKHSSKVTKHGKFIQIFTTNDENYDKVKSVIDSIPFNFPQKPNTLNRENTPQIKR